MPSSGTGEMDDSSENTGIEPNSALPMQSHSRSSTPDASEKDQAEYAKEFEQSPRLITSSEGLLAASQVHHVNNIRKGVCCVSWYEVLFTRDRLNYSARICASSKGLVANLAVK